MNVSRLRLDSLEGPPSGNEARPQRGPPVISRPINDVPSGGPVIVVDRLRASARRGTMVPSLRRCTVSCCRLPSALLGALAALAAMASDECAADLRFPRPRRRPGKEERNVVADNLVCRVPVDALGGRIPARDQAIRRHSCSRWRRPTSPRSPQADPRSSLARGECCLPAHATTVPQHPLCRS